MRILVSILITLGVGCAMYLMYLKSAGSRSGGTALRAISTTSVKAQLVNIAEAERIYYVQNNSYATLQELTSTGAIKFKTPDPTGYTYAVDTNTSGFTATARRDQDKGGPSADYPTLSIDETMKIAGSD